MGKGSVCFVPRKWMPSRMFRAITKAVRSLRVRAFAANVKAVSNVVGGIIATAILLMVGVMLVGYFQKQTASQIATLNNTAATTAYTNIAGSVWGALNLMGLYPWILGAVAILGVVALLAR